VADFSCDLPTLITASACFSDNCLGQSDRDAIDIWIRIKALAAAGGTDYSANLSGLLSDAALWVRRPADTIRAIELYIDLLSANEDGAGLSTNANTLLGQAKCLRSWCLGREQTRGLKAFLKCAIQAQGVPT
jgi:hypothetical protein